MKLQNELLKILSEFMPPVKETFPVVLNVSQFHLHIICVTILLDAWR